MWSLDLLYDILRAITNITCLRIETFFYIFNLLKYSWLKKKNI